MTRCSREGGRDLSPIRGQSRWLQCKTKASGQLVSPFNACHKHEQFKEAKEQEASSRSKRRFMFPPILHAVVPQTDERHNEKMTTTTNNEVQTAHVQDGKGCRAVEKLCQGEQTKVSNGVVWKQVCEVTRVAL